MPRREKSPLEPQRRLAFESLLILAGFALIVLVIDPRGDFPLNDDWNFALGTWWFAEHGEFRFARFTGMSLRAQVLWGALWTDLFGRSFEVLRASTLFLAAATLLVFHRLAARTGFGAFGRMLSTGALAAHPIFLWSSFTYMTQVPFLFASVCAIYCWVRGAAARSAGWFAAGSALLAVSYFIRQSGIAMVLAGILALAVVWRGSGRSFRLGAGALLAAPVILFLILILATELLHGRPEEFALRFGLLDLGPARLAATLATQAARSFALVMQYAVISLLGLALAAGFRRMTRGELALALLLAIPVAWGASELVSLKGPMPYASHGNVIADGGFGPLTMRDTWVFGYPPPRTLPLSFRWTLTVLSVALASLAMGRIAATGVRLARGAEVAGITAAAAAGALMGGTAILFTTDILFDRYSLDAGWPLALLLPLITIWTPWRRVVAVGVTAAILAFSAAGVSDYLAWNRARWEAFAWLRDRGVTLDRIDGGYEINQYLVGGFDGAAFLRKAQFSVVDDEWILALNEVRGYRTVARVKYERWSGDGTVFIQQRTGGFIPVFDLQQEER
ncbi:MAG: hypothetical protein ABR517_14880 [Thermoanaerobaculia bacterium]